MEENWEEKRFMWYCKTKLQDHELIVGSASCAYQAKMNSNVHALFPTL